MDGFSPEVRDGLRQFLEGCEGRRKLAIFDADGTLWRGDVGEAFFRYQLERRTVPHAPKKKPWETYFKEANGGDTAKAFGWLAQWNAGVREADLVRWCEEFFHGSWAHFVFEPMRALAHALLNSGFELWVVTGSPRWIVQAGVSGFGIPADHVIGTSVVIEGGVLTDVIENEVPYRAGKARLIEKLLGVAPAFVAGNTYWDKEMMVLATGQRLAVHSEKKGEPNFESEQKLRKLALSNGWLVQGF